MRYLLMNLGGILLGGLISRPAERLIARHHIQSMLIIANICVAIIGIQGAIQTQNSILLLLSCVIGGLVGSAIDIDRQFVRFGEWLKTKFRSEDENFSKGLITVFLMQAVGSMAILGPLNAALNNDPSILLFKTVLDFTSTLIYGAIYGKSVILSGPLVFLYQGAIYLFADLIAPFLSTTMTAEISAVGSVIIFALSLDLLGILKVKSANYLPALLGPVLYYAILGLFT